MTVNLFLQGLPGIQHDIDRNQIDLLLLKDVKGFFDSNGLQDAVSVELKGISEGFEKGLLVIDE